MNKKKETANIDSERVNTFLFYKAAWVWLLFYLAATALLFGISCIALYLLDIQPLTGVLFLTGTGVFWGTAKYFQNVEKARKIKRTNEKTEAKTV